MGSTLMEYFLEFTYMHANAGCGSDDAFKVVCGVYGGVECEGMFIVSIGNHVDGRGVGDDLLQGRVGDGHGIECSMKGFVDRRRCGDVSIDVDERMTSNGMDVGDQTRGGRKELEKRWGRMNGFGWDSEVN